MLHALSRDFELDDKRQILAFLESHPAVVSLLPEIRSKIRDYFGDEPVRLEVFLDPEWEDAPPELFAVVRTTRPSREALDLIHRFDREWWLPWKARIGSPVVVSFDHIKRV
jgi:hypothetical protein